MARQANIGDAGACARCRQYHHCNGSVAACGCQCSGAAIVGAPDGAWAGASGVLHGCAFAWCERGSHYHLASARVGRARLAGLGGRGRVRLTWSPRVGAPTSFVDADTGRPVVGAIAGDVRTITPDALAASVARHHAAADASRDRHGATPSALPSAPVVVRDTPLTTVARVALRQATRPSTARERADHARDRATWAASFDARLASRDA